jgi:hypothetical protein
LTGEIFGAVIYEDSLMRLARTIIIRCIYGILCRDFIKRTTVHGTYIHVLYKRFWPSLLISNV